MKKFIQKLAFSAGGVILNGYWKSKQAQYKDGLKSILTKTDLETEKTIIGFIRKKYPNHNILSEEIGEINKKSNYTWIIDPLDGTANFSQNIPLFCVSIALMKDKTIQEGALYDPIHNDFYYAKRGQGAYLNNKKINVSKINNLEDALCGFGFGKAQEALVGFNKIARKARKSRILGSTGIALAYVACGNLDSYIVNHINSWDIAAGCLLIKEAGGETTDIKGEKINFNNDKKYIIVSNKKIHQEIIRTLR